MSLKTTVNSREFDVTVNSLGVFYTELEGDRVSADSLRELTSKLKTRMTQLQQVSVPALLIEHDGWKKRGLFFTPVTITGTHLGRHRDLTYREGDNPKVGKAGSGSHFYRRIDLDEKVLLIQLHAAFIEAQSVWLKTLKGLEMDAAAEVERAAYLGNIPAEPPAEQPKGQRKKR